MDSKSVLRIEPKGSGFLVIKDGGSAEFVYARATKAEVKAIIDETYPDEVDEPAVERLLPPHIQALQDHAQASDEAVS